MAFVCGMEGTNLCRCACAPQLELRLPWTNAEMRPAPASAMALTVAMLAFASCEVVVFPLVVGLARLAEVLASSSRLLRRALSLPSSSVRLSMPSAASPTKLPGSWTAPPSTWMTISPSPSVSPSSNIDATMLAVDMMMPALVAAATSPLAASAVGWPVV